MLIVEVMNEARSSTVDSVHIALAEMPCAFDIRNPSPTSGTLIKEPSQGLVGFIEHLFHYARLSGYHLRTLNKRMACM